MSCALNTIGSSSVFTLDANIIKNPKGASFYEEANLNITEHLLPPFNLDLEGGHADFCLEHKKFWETVLVDLSAQHRYEENRFILLFETRNVLKHWDLDSEC